MLYLHIFLTGIIGWNLVKFMPQDEILGTPLLIPYTYLFYPVHLGHFMALHLRDGGPNNYTVPRPTPTIIRAWHFLNKGNFTNYKNLINWKSSTSPYRNLSCTCHRNMSTDEFSPLTIMNVLTCPVRRHFPVVVVHSRAFKTLHFARRITPWSKPRQTFIHR